MSRIDLDVCVNYDYPINGVISFFESYMFITTDKWIKQHPDKIGGEISLIHNGKEKIIKMEKLEDRKNALHEFNNNLKEKYNGNIPEGQELGIFEITFDDWNSKMPDVNTGFSYDFFAGAYFAYNNIKNIIINWSKRNNRTIAMAWHLFQTKTGNLVRIPHVHVIYSKENPKLEHNTLPNYINSFFEIEQKY